MEDIAQIEYDIEAEAAWFESVEARPPLDESRARPEVENILLSCEDCMETMANLPDGLLHAVVTDPPYGMNLGGAKWDASIPSTAVWREVLRVMKPGGMLIAASHARTYHQLGTILELAGFEVIDMIHWTYDRSFPAGRTVGGEWHTVMKRAHEPWAVARAPLGVVEYPGKKKVRTRKRGLQEVFDAHGTGAFRVRGNGQGKGWATNSIAASKPSASERALGLDPAVVRGDGNFVKAQANPHMTVKPIGLMRRLVRLVASPGDWVMDPFMGSGTTGVACMAEGMNFVGAEMDPTFAAIAQDRIEYAYQAPDLVPPAV